MGELVALNFQTGEVEGRTEYSSTQDGSQGAHTLREVLTAEQVPRHQLIEQAAFVAAHLDIAKTGSDPLEVADLEITLSDCMKALKPGLNEEELGNIQKRTNQIIVELSAN